MAEQRGIPLQEPPLCDDRLIWDTWMAAYHLPALTVADELGVFPLLAQAPATTQELATRLSLGVRGTEVLLGVLTAVGFLVQYQGRFHLTETSRSYLLPDSPFYYGGVLRTYYEHPVSHTALREALRNDSPASQPSSTANIIEAWQAGELPIEQAVPFARLTHSLSMPAAMGVARRGNFVGVRKLLDIAGGSGCCCIALALCHPDIQFTILELPAVCLVAEHYVAKYALQGQIATHAANMFTDTWPCGHDGVFFSNIFHDWDRPTCLHLARRSFEILPPGGRIYLHEMLLSDTKDGPRTAATFSMLMLVANMQGTQYTGGELDALLREAGFIDVSIVPTYAYYSLVSARKPI